MKNYWKDLIRIKRIDRVNEMVIITMISKIIKKINNRLFNISFQKGYCDFIYPFLQNDYFDAYKAQHDRKKILFLMQPTYGNVGDQAIAMASLLFLKKEFSEYKIINVSERDTLLHIKTLEAICSKDDIIVLQGGGNMGDLYIRVERLRRFCIKHFMDNLIISMPTTMTYTSTKKGQKELLKSEKVYNKHTKLILLAREKYTYDAFCTHYTNSIVKKLVPDIVFYLKNNIQMIDKTRQGVMICLRREQESILSDDDRNTIISSLTSSFLDYCFIDTEVKRKILPELREQEVLSMLNQFSGVRAIVTDRMHAMVFSYLTNTPCVVIKSLDRKIEGCYEWIKSRKNIVLCDDYSAENILKKTKAVLDVQCEYEDVGFDYSVLGQLIREYYRQE